MTITPKLFKKNLFESSYAFTTVVGVLMLVLSLCINFVAISYAARSAAAGTTDILLDNLPLVNTDLIFSEGALVFVLFITILSFYKPKTIPFTLKNIALFITIRSLFVVMTHYGPYVHHIAVDYSVAHYLSSGADLFFSGHTGLPFLMALMYWEHRFLRRFFILCSVVAAIAVILGHLHYTIDVFSAYFITYGVHKICERIFVSDRALFNIAYEKPTG